MNKCVATKNSSRFLLEMLIGQAIFWTVEYGINEYGNKLYHVYITIVDHYYIIILIFK